MRVGTKRAAVRRFKRLLAAESDAISPAVYARCGWEASRRATWPRWEGLADWQRRELIEDAFKAFREEGAT